jgi:transcriptional activator HAC1
MTTEYSDMTMDASKLKYEDSPVESLAESFVSTPGALYPLYEENQGYGDFNTEVMTPRSYNDNESSFGDDLMIGGSVGTPDPEKKPVKKRKSWGQQLPTPKTTLPPRKRAKTEDEKEQRRVERVLRNRRAAQTSRERKRQEVEALEAQKLEIERRNKDLEMRLQDLEARNMELQQQLNRVTGGNMDGNNMAAFRPSISSTPHQFEQARPSQDATLTQDLFNSHDGLPTDSQSMAFQPVIASAPVRTVDPASLSPEMRPVADPSTNAVSSDMTQHPAAMLCDLQCQSEEQWLWTMSTTMVISQILAMSFLIASTQAFSTSLQSLYQIIHSLKTQSMVPATPCVLATIIWMVTTKANLTTCSMISYTTKTTHSQRPRFSLRIRLLRRLLACSPHLARPLMDATMVAMRLSSEQQLARDCMSSVAVCESRDKNSPSMESLMTLLWATKVIDSERRQRESLADTVTDLKQACGELDERLQRLRGGSSVKGGKFTSTKDGPASWEKSF